MKLKILILLSILATIASILASFSQASKIGGKRIETDEKEISLKQNLKTGAEAGVSDNHTPDPTATVRKYFEEGSTVFKSYIPLLTKPVEPSWPMAGSNPARTSWTTEEVRGNLKPLWYRPFEPHILPRVQVIAADSTLYISTSAGLYALDAATGIEKWVYATGMPLGHSPTVHEGVVYVGGYDRKLHAIDASTGQGRWTFEAGAGFDTNPLVVDGKVYAGNRDGFFYTIFANGPQAGKLAWKFQTQGPIHFSAAYKDGIVYFASNDSFAYALNAQTGGLVWKSAKLPGAGFHSWWPVIYRDVVIFSGSLNYRHDGVDPGQGFRIAEEDEIFPNRKVDPRGTLIGPVGNEQGDWVRGTATIDMSKSNITPNGSTKAASEYFEEKPWRRTYFVLDRKTGQENTYDFDQDGKPEYAPILWMGTGGGNRYPPVVGSDGVLYQMNKYMSDEWINAGQVSGWKIETPFISLVNTDWGARDEPHAYSAGGNLIYWNLCCDRQAGAFDIRIPEDKFSPAPVDGPEIDRQWLYFSYNLPDLVPGYNANAFSGEIYYKPDTVSGGRNGVYGWHGDVNPPIPFDGRVYMHRGNAVIAFAPQAAQPAALPMAQKANPGVSGASSLSKDQLKERLADEVRKMLNAGHLRPGYVAGSGPFEHQARFNCGDMLQDYWHNPSDVIITLLRTLPYLTSDLQQAVKDYLQNEFNTFPPYKYNHTGWKDGAPREAFDLPPEVEADRVNISAATEIYNFKGWRFNPYSFYGLWKYAQTFGGAKGIFDLSMGRLEPAPADAVLTEMPHVNNAYIAGYLGYLELQKMAGYPESADIRAALDRLLALKIATFSVELPAEYFESNNTNYCRALSASRNFIYLTPELGQYLHDNAQDKIQQAVNEYARLAPLWFVSNLESGFGESVINPLYDYHAIFQARSLILKQPYAELVKYIDVPAVAVGDLFYIENLVAAIEAGN